MMVEMETYDLYRIVSRRKDSDDPWVPERASHIGGRLRTYASLATARGVKTQLDKNNFYGPRKEYKIQRVVEWEDVE